MCNKQDLYGQRYFSFHINVNRNLFSVNQNKSSIYSTLSCSYRASFTGGITSTGLHTWVRALTKAKPSMMPYRKWHAPCLQIVLSSGDNRRNKKNQDGILLRHQESNHPSRPPLIVIILHLVFRVVHDRISRHRTISTCTQQVRFLMERRTFIMWAFLSWWIKKIRPFFNPVTKKEATWVQIWRQEENTIESFVQEKSSGRRSTRPKRTKAAYFYAALEHNSW